MNHILVIVNGNVNYTGLLKWLELSRFLHKKTVKMGFLKKFIKIIRIEKTALFRKSAAYSSQKKALFLKSAL